MKDSSIITILSVGGVEEDRAALSEILARAASPLCPGSRWSLEACPSVPSALAALRKQEMAIVICDSDLGSESWRELWEQAAALPNPPFLIVTSRLADEYLWAEALNLGAYDVLAKPFHAPEVIRTISQAWLHRTNRPQRSSRALSAVGHPWSGVNPEQEVAV